MPSQQEMQKFMALREAKKRGMLGPTQSAAVGELENRFSQYFKEVSDRAKSVAEPAMTMASSMVAEPLSGLAGIAGTILPGLQGQGAEWVRGTQDALTYMPKSESGQRSLQGLASLMRPVGNALQTAEQYAGEVGYNLAGPLGGAMMATIPAAASEIAGVGKPARAAGKMRRLYHASNADFKKFEPARVGDRMTALGLGHYLTPSKKKASQYGSNVMEFDVDMSDVLDFDDLKMDQVKKISDELMGVVPDRVLAGFGERKVKVLPKNKEGMAEFRKMQGQMKDLQHDRAKPKLLSKSEIPDDVKIGPDEVAISYMEPPKDLMKVRPEDLVTLMQEYNQVIPKRLGYKGAKFGDEIAIYDSELPVRVK